MAFIFKSREAAFDPAAPAFKEEDEVEDEAEEEPVGERDPLGDTRAFSWAIATGKGTPAIRQRNSGLGVSTVVAVAMLEASVGAAEGAEFPPLLFELEELDSCAFDDADDEDALPSPLLAFEDTPSPPPKPPTPPPACEGRPPPIDAPEVPGVVYGMYLRAG